MPAAAWDCLRERAVEHPLPISVPDARENVAKALLNAHPPKTWDYMKKQPPHA